MTIPWRLLPLVAALALTGCGDDKPIAPDDKDSESGVEDNIETGAPDGIEPEPEPEPDFTTLSGNVADGYLQSALVCADLNMSMTCDADEPQANSEENGSWTMEISSELMSAGTRILAEATADVTVDEDTGKPIENGYTLMTEVPVDQQGDPIFVSPLTTLIAYEAMNGQWASAAEAEEAIKSRLTTTADLGADYIAAKQNEALSEDEKQEFEYIHRIARLVATIKGIREESLRQLGGYSAEEIATAGTEDIVAALDVINVDARAELDEGSTFDPKAIIENGNYVNVTLND